MKIHELDADKEYIFIFNGLSEANAQRIGRKLNRWLNDYGGKDPLAIVLLTKDALLVDIIEMDGTPKVIHVSQQVDICGSESTGKAYIGPPPFRADMDSIHSYTISFNAGEYYNKYTLPTLGNNSWLLGFVFWINEQWQKIDSKQ